MKKLLLALTVLAFQAPAYADTYVSGYCKKDGTCVEGYWRSDSNGTTSDNYSTKGNTNPYTGKKGTKKDSSSSYNWN
jgi:hypothetical protein